MRILIAEDDGVSRIVLTTKLKKMGHEVIATEDGVAAWEEFRAKHPQLVITDWMMPNVDGLELCRRIRSYEQEKYAYVIMLTALAGKKNYYEGMNAGADDFLTKPVDMEDLTARLRVAGRILALQTEVKQLEGLLTICAYCKKIRNEDNTWQPIEGYISMRSEAEFSHGYCPACYDQHIKPQLEEMRITRDRRQ